MKLKKYLSSILEKKVTVLSIYELLDLRCLPSLEENQYPNPSSPYALIDSYIISIKFMNAF